MDDWRETLLAGAEVAARIDRLMAAQLNWGPYGRPAGRVLMTLQTYPGDTHSALGARLGMASSQISRTVSPLVEQGLIETLPSPRHKVRRLLSLSAKGNVVASELRAARLEAFDAVMAKASRQERNAMSGMFRLEPMRVGSASTTIREATQADAVAAFHAIALQRQFKTAYLSEFAKALSVHFKRWHEEHPGFVEIGADGSLVGVALLTAGTTLEDDPSDDLGIMMIGPWVHPDFRRRGIARRLVSQCVKQASDCTFGMLFASASSRLPELSKFLLKCRFIKTGDAAELDPVDLRYGVHTYVRMLTY